MPTKRRKSGLVVKPAATTACQSGKGQESNRKLYPKESWCGFCLEEQLLSNIQRHYELKHGNETQVKEIKKVKEEIEKSQDEEEKKALMKKKDNLQAMLRNQGNFRHNVECLRKGKGDLMVVRRPEVETNADEFLPCPDCLGFYMSYDMYKHSCPGVSQKYQQKRRGEILLNETLTPYLTAGEGTRKILNGINDSSLRELITKDALILKFVAHLVDKHSSDSTNQETHIRERTRVLGKFLRHVREQDGYEHVDLTELLSSPANYDIVAQCAQTLSKSAIELPRKIGHTIRKCLVLLKGIGLRTANRDLISNAQLFNELMATEWSDLVSSKSLKKQHQQKMNKDFHRCQS